ALDAQCVRLRDQRILQRLVLGDHDRVARAPLQAERRPGEAGATDDKCQRSPPQLDSEQRRNQPDGVEIGSEMHRWASLLCRAGPGGAVRLLWKGPDRGRATVAPARRGVQELRSPESQAACFVPGRTPAGTVHCLPRRATSSPGRNATMIAVPKDPRNAAQQTPAPGTSAALPVNRLPAPAHLIEGL